MPIVVNLDVMLAKRKMSLSKLSKASGVSMTSLSMLKNNKAKGFRFSAMERICLALTCSFDDIIQVVTEEEYFELFNRQWAMNED